VPVANNTFPAASVLVFQVASMCHSTNRVPVHYYSCCQSVIPGIVILLSEQAATVEGNESFVSHLTIKETFYLENTPELQTCCVSVV
jgi:hypothetical protein